MDAVNVDTVNFCPNVIPLIEDVCKAFTITGSINTIGAALKQGSIVGRISKQKLTVSIFILSMPDPATNTRYP